MGNVLVTDVTLVQWWRNQKCYGKEHTGLSAKLPFFLFCIIKLSKPVWRCLIHNTYSFFR